MPMDVSVLRMREKSRLRARFGLSLAGDTFIERARSTTFALLGMVAAIGLLSVALAVRQDWPLIGGSPIPGSGSESGAVHIAKAVALTHGSTPPAPGLVARAPVAGTALPSVPPARRQDGRKQVVAGSTPLATAPAGETGPPEGQPEEPPVAQPVAEEPVEAPAPEPIPASPTNRPATTTTKPGTVTTVGSLGSSQASGGPGKSVGRDRGAEQRATPPTPAESQGGGATSTGRSSQGASSGRGGGPPAGHGGGPPPSQGNGGGTGNGSGGGHGRSGH